MISRLLSAVLLLSATNLAAQEPEEPTRKFGVQRVFAVGVGQPQGLSGSVGLVIGSVPAKPVKCALGYWTDGVLIQVEPGVGGGRLNLGLASTNALGGWGAKASVLRTWGKPWGTRPGTNYAGGEVSFAWLIRTNVGVLRRFGNGQGGKTLISWNVGIGF